jgi:hypothetical protein
MTVLVKLDNLDIIFKNERFIYIQLCLEYDGYIECNEHIGKILRYLLLSYFCSDKNSVSIQIYIHDKGSGMVFWIVYWNIHKSLFTKRLNENQSQNSSKNARSKTILVRLSAFLANDDNFFHGIPTR